MTSTNNTKISILADYLKLNKYFSSYEQVKKQDINSNQEIIISPVNAKVVKIGKINRQGRILSKNNKVVELADIMGRYSENFKHAKYINFYLSPKNKHFWVTPYKGRFIYTQQNNGKALIPVFLGLENILGFEMFSKAVKKNASITSIFQTKDIQMAMVAVGSLNVNKIETNYKENEIYAKSYPCGRFLLGSSMLLCFPDKLQILVNQGNQVKIGQGILKF